MKKNWNWILLFILAAAFILRIFRIVYAYPLTIVSDETPSLLASLKMIGDYSLRAAAPGYYYPALSAYIALPFLIVFLAVGWLLGIFTTVEAIKETVLLNLGAFIPVVRFISVFFGVLSVYLVYKISVRLFNDKRTGLIAAWFLAVSYFHVYNSHFAQTWTTQTFFILLALYTAINFYQKEFLGVRHYILSGLIIGLAFGINLVGILSYFWFLLVHFLKNKKNGWLKIFIKNRNFWLMNLFLFLVIGVIYYLNPYGLENPYHRIIDTEAPVIMGGGGYATYKPFSWLFFEILIFYVQSVFLQEPVFFILGILGSVFLWLHKRIAFYFLASWIVLYFILVSPLTSPISRYMLPTLPLTIIIGADFSRFILSKIAVSKLPALIAILIISGQTFLFSIFFDFRMTKNDTYILARNWILNNIESGSRIQNEYLGGKLLLTENKEAIKLIQSKRPNLFSTKRKYLLNLPDENYPQPNYLLSAYRDISNLIPKFDYVILSDFAKDGLKKQAEDLPESAELVKYFYPIENEKAALVSTKSLLDERWPPTDDIDFDPRALFLKVDYNGPYIEIYKLRP